MSTGQDILDCYNKTAAQYAAEYGGELAEKHLDPILLRAFADTCRNGGKLLDLGCGPGQTTAFLQRHGADVTGTDLSPKMIETAKGLYPSIRFEVADMLRLPYENGLFTAVLSFYSIVHFEEQDLIRAFAEMSRVLHANGILLLAFHIGSETIHRDEFLGENVNINFYFHDPAKVVSMLEKCGFASYDRIEREPYAGIEYASRRAYIFARKAG